MGADEQTDKIFFLFSFFVKLFFSFCFPGGITTGPLEFIPDRSLG
jgi:hypothetical protein